MKQYGWKDAVNKKKGKFGFPDWALGNVSGSQLPIFE
jgi:hypothetical protein